MDNKEKEILARLSANKKESARLNKELSKHRNERAKKVREMYFKERMTQKKIASAVGINQPSVSRIICEYSCADIQRQLTR